MEEIKSSILKTLSFFSIFSYPLTKEELLEFLWKKKTDWQELENSLSVLVKEQKIFSEYGYYFLPDGQDGVESRRTRLIDNENKFKKAVKACKKISWLPFVRAVFVCNSLAFGTANQKSDIDFFIITDSKRLWLVRFFSNLLLLVLGLRVNKNKSGVCLSFFISKDFLNLQSIRIQEEDIYLTYWIALLIPLYDPDVFHKKIISENKWLLDFLPQISSELSIYAKEVKNGQIKKMVKNILEKIWQGAYGELMEKQAAEAQKTKIKLSARDKNFNFPGVILNDDMLKFHENDRRKEYYEKWCAKLQDLRYE